MQSTVHITILQVNKISSQFIVAISLSVDISSTFPSFSFASICFLSFNKKSRKSLYCLSLESGTRNNSNGGIETPSPVFFADIYFVVLAFCGQNHSHNNVASTHNVCHVIRNGFNWSTMVFTWSTMVFILSTLVFILSTMMFI